MIKISNKMKKLIIGGVGTVVFGVAVPTIVQASEAETYSSIETAINTDKTTSGSAITLEGTQDMLEIKDLGTYSVLSTDAGKVITVPAGYSELFVEATTPSENNSYYKINDIDVDTYVTFLSNKDGVREFYQQTSAFTVNDSTYMDFYNRVNGIEENNNNNNNNINAQNSYTVSFDENKFNDTYANKQALNLSKTVNKYTVTVNFVNENGDVIETQSREFTNPYFGISDSAIAVINGKINGENQFYSMAITEEKDDHYQDYINRSLNYKNTFESKVVEENIQYAPPIAMIIKDGKDYESYECYIEDNNTIHTIILPSGKSIEIDSSKYSIGSFVTIIADMEEFKIGNDTITVNKNLNHFQEKYRLPEEVKKDEEVILTDEDKKPEQKVEEEIQEEIKVITNDDCKDEITDKPDRPDRPNKPTEDNTNFGDDEEVKLPPLPTKPDPKPDPVDPIPDPDPVDPIPDPVDPTVPIKYNPKTGDVNTDNYTLAQARAEAIKSLATTAGLASMLIGAGLVFKNKRNKKPSLIDKIKKTSNLFKNSKKKSLFDNLGLVSAEQKQQYKRLVLA